MCYESFKPGLANLFEGIPKLSINFEEIILCASGNLEEQSKALEPSKSLLIIALLLMHMAII
jgi:hypothetical protein